MIKAVVFELKKDFNTEFAALQNNKEDQLLTIQEKNEAIMDLLQNLNISEELFAPKSHDLENPEAILSVDPSEIKVEKYYTKEERAQQEEERRIREAKEAARSGDTIQTRGLKTMMGGTELNLQKKKNEIDESLQREDWMNKPVEEMTDEEKAKLKDFETRLKEFKEKQKKAWE